jgi:hypothetical protein
MIRLLLFVLLFCGPAPARADGRYANSRLKEWFNRLARLTSGDVNRRLEPCG